MVVIVGDRCLGGVDGEPSTLYLFVAPAATMHLARVITPSILPHAKFRCYTSVVVNAKWLLLAG